MRGKSISPAVKGALWALLAVFILAAALFGLRQFRAADAFREEMARLGAGEGWTVTVRSLPLAEEVTLTGDEAGRLVSAALGLSFAGRDSGGPYQVYDGDLELHFHRDGSPCSPISLSAEGDSRMDCPSGIDVKLSGAEELYGLAQEALDAVI